MHGGTMTKRSILAMLLLCCAVPCVAQPDWEMIHSGRWVESIRFFTSERGIAAGRGDLLLLTTDGGLTWSIIQDQGWGFEISFPRVVIASPTVGYIISFYGGLLRTTDAGETWVAKPHSLNGDMRTGWFIDEMTGWIGGGTTGGRMYKTTDGGTTWTAITIPINTGIESIYFLDSLRGWACGQAGEMLRTTNGGTTWQLLNSGTTEHLFAIHFTSPTNGFAAGNNKTVLRTTNGGTSWSPISIQTSSAAMRDIDFFGNNGAIIGYGPVGATSVKLVTTNAGASWTEVTDTTGSPFTVGYASANVVCQAGIGAVARSSNAGVSWQKVLDLPQYDFRRLRFLNSSVGYAIGSTQSNDGFMLKSIDAGATWERQTDPVISSGVLDMWWTSATTGAAVGTSGKIVRTVDGGSTWSTVTSPTTQRLEAVTFYLSTGYAAGLQGTILKTTNSGATWTQLSSGSTTRLRVLAAQFSNTVWAAGDSGRILKSTDAGATWSPQSSGTTQPIVALYFRDTQRGWLLTNTAALRQTTNGGETWQSRTLPGISSTGDIKAITFVDNNIGWVTGRYDPCYTTDGGTTWYAQRTPGSLRGGRGVVYFLNANRGWIAGSEGTVFRTDNGGVTPVSIQVTSPNGGEVLSGGTQHMITWNATNTGSGHVRITLRRESGFAEDLGTAAGYLGQFAWSVPDTTLDSLKIRVRDELHLSVWDESDGYFSISPAVSVGEPEAPIQFSLLQNYPNPFNPSTTFAFAIGHSASITLKVYDLLGREVTTLVNEAKEPGRHTVAWDASGVASGVYFYRIEARGNASSHVFTAVKKMVVVK
jgi:photosystem II stability/assembly factor-like uncharacterized protein